jgi:hypothetical protein
MRRETSGRINEEYVSFDSFYQYLKAINNNQEITYFEETDDPPDYWVMISGTKYAVEITSIVKDYGTEVLYSRFLDNIKSEFAPDNNIKGTYVLYIKGKPKIPTKKSLDWNMLISAIATKIQDMSNYPKGTTDLLLNKTGKIVISKVSNEGAKIVPSITGAKWNGEIQEELAQIIQKLINDKRQKLINKDVLQKCKNIILLLYDAYGYSDIENIRKAFLKVHDYEWLHSIFVALAHSNTSNILYPESPGRKGIFLYSKNGIWYKHPN